MNKKAQVYLEMVLLLALATAAFLAMLGYIKGAVQRNWKSNADAFSDEQYQGNVDAFSNEAYAEEEQSTETDTYLQFRGSTLEAKRMDETSLANFDLASESGNIFKVPGWGVDDY